MTKIARMHIGESLHVPFSSFINHAHWKRKQLFCHMLKLSRLGHSRRLLTALFSLLIRHRLLFFAQRVTRSRLTFRRAIGGSG